MENYKNEMKRREFFKRSSLLAGATVFMGFGGSKLWSAFINSKSTLSIPTVILSNGVSMPMLGFGTNTLNGDVGTRSVSDAISVGYRLIDTAHIYGNEESVGVGIKQSGVEREKLFVTSKLWVDDAGYETTKVAFQTTLNKLQLEYLDLYLIHRPRGDVKGTWKAMEELYQEGKIKAIGVSNFNPEQLDELKSYAKVEPALNQIETHAFFVQTAVSNDLKERRIQHEAWSPLAAGRGGIFENKILAGIGAKYNKSIAQVCLRWHHQRGIIAIPRSSNKNHMIENLNIFDFELSDADIQGIEKLDLSTTVFPEWE